MPNSVSTAERLLASIDGRRMALLLVALLGLRLVSLAVSGLEVSHDEAQYWAWGQDLAFGYYTKPPLVGWVARLVSETCGASAFCLRLPAPLFHTATAFVLFLIGRRLYGATAGVWAALLYATGWGVTISSMLWTTDVPLLFFWSLALLFLVDLTETRRWRSAVLLGIAIGLGLNAKYAMIYLPGCLILWCAVSREDRRWLRDGRLWLAMAVAFVCILPNLIWVAANGFATFRHTAENASWGEALSLYPRAAIEFVLGQFPIMDPIVFALFLFLLARPGARAGPARADRLMVFVSVPVFAVITIQGLMAGRTHGNWAVAAFPAVILLVAAWLVARRAWRTMAWAVGIQVAVALAVAVGVAFVDRLQPPLANRQIARLLGWSDFFGKVEALAREAGIATVVADGREMTAQMIYGLRDSGLTVLSLRDPDAPPRDQFEMARPWVAGDATPVLLVTPADPAGLPLGTATVTPAGTIDTSIFAARGGTMPAWRIDGPAGPAAPAQR
jgi:4-amino-4-deoxy-L-arabinose transferase-like glycosyltransferase